MYIKIINIHYTICPYLILIFKSLLHKKALTVLSTQHGWQINMQTLDNNFKNEHPNMYGSTRQL